MEHYERTDRDGPGLGCDPLQGWYCGVPGLVVLFRGQQLRLVHVDSGHALEAFPSLDAARGAAEAVAEACDWTLPLGLLDLSGEELAFVAHALEVYGGGRTELTAPLPPFEFFWSRPADGLPPTDSEVLLAAPGWRCGVDGLAVAFAARQLRLVHLASGRAVVSFPTLAAARATAPFLLPLVAPRGWTAPYGELAGDRRLWAGVAAAAAYAGGGPSVDLVDTVETLDEPDARCQVLRPAWSTADDGLAVVLTSDGLRVAERTTGEVLGASFPRLGEARRAAVALAASLAADGLSPAAWAARWRERHGVDAPLGPRNLRS